MTYTLTFTTPEGVASLAYDLLVMCLHDMTSLQNAGHTILAACSG